MPGVPRDRQPPCRAKRPGDACTSGQGGEAKVEGCSADPELGVPSARGVAGGSDFPGIFPGKINRKSYENLGKNRKPIKYKNLREIWLTNLRQFFQFPGFWEVPGPEIRILLEISSPEPAGNCR